MVVVDDTMENTMGLGEYKYVNACNTIIILSSFKGTRSHRACSLLAHWMYTTLSGRSQSEH